MFLQQYFLHTRKSGDHYEKARQTKKVLEPLIHLAEAVCG